MPHFFLLKILINIFILFFSVLSFGQVPDLELQEVNIHDSVRKSSDRVLTIKRTTILELQPEDAGQILQKMAGVNVKSYGGLGGLKTISVRSLGSQHTSIVVDGFALSNTQTGQINLGQIQTENIEAVYLVTGAQKSFLVPASAQVSGSSLFIETFENTNSIEKHKVRFNSKVGSFGQYDNYLAYKFSLKKMYVSVFGKYRNADGNYKYSFQNGNTLYEGTRENNRYVDMYGGISFGWRLKNGLVQLNYRSETSDQELPGAVILYSQNAFQTLKTKNHRVQVAYVRHFKKLTMRLFSSGITGDLEYNDPTFLNDAGGINSIYKNEQIQAGINLRYDLNSKIQLFGAAEEQISRLESNEEGIGRPLRFHNFYVLGGRLNLNFIHITAQLSSQFIIENNDTLKRANEFRSNPFVQLESVTFSKKWKMNGLLFYRNSFRMPSFNELYYNNVGNKFLKPEDANQLSLGVVLNPKFGKFSILNRSSVYFNQVNNKIVAIPTKNLFIWSMQNIGKVNIFGIESTFDIFYKLNDTWSIASNLNYTYQTATDITDTESPTFGHQIAYIPKHSFNADLSVKRKSLGVRWSTFGNSFRYSLNENVPSNEVEGFTISDVAIFGSFDLKNHNFRWQFSCKNFLNASYAIVRYYVMPGRNYLISLNYALN